jgi:hypothetical protein
MVVVLILYAFTDSVLVATANSYAMRVLVAEPLTTLSLPFALLLSRCLSDSWRDELQSVLLEPLFSLLQRLLRVNDNLLALFGM